MSALVSRKMWSHWLKIVEYSCHRYANATWKSSLPCVCNGSWFNFISNKEWKWSSRKLFFFNLTSIVQLYKQCPERKIKCLKSKNYAILFYGGGGVSCTPLWPWNTNSWGQPRTSDPLPLPPKCWGYRCVQAHPSRIKPLPAKMV